MMSIVLLSGGLDSAVALALRLPSVAETLTVDYGQTHRREIDAAAAIADHYGVSNRVVLLDPALFDSSALVGGADIPDHCATQPDPTYVPARNTVLLALAAARAETLGVGNVVIGANADDAAAYPDCRRGYLEAFRDVLVEGTVRHVWIDAPLLSMGKSQVVELAAALAVPTDLTYSCYRGGAQPCGRCGACLTRGAQPC